jgi:methionyl-tRNA formyltransferase
MLMDKGMDTGDMLHKLSLPIEDNDTSETLFNKLMPLGASALKATLIKLRDGKAVRVKQNEEDATYAPMILKADAIIDWSDSADNIINKIRGMNPAPVAATYYNGKKVKIYEAVKGEETDDTDYGKIWGFFEDKGLGIVAGGNIVYINEFHVENSKRMAVSDYMKGNKLEPGEYFTGIEE